MTAAERNQLCERHHLGVTWDCVDCVWIVERYVHPFELIARAIHRDTAIDLAADRLAERGLL